MLCSLALLAGSSASGEAAGDDAQAAMAAFIARIESSERALRSAPAFGSETEQALGYMHLSRAIIRSIESQVLQDADYPYFRILDFWLREGGDNPDQRYAFSPLRGGEAYRIWGTLGSAARVEVQLYAGEPWAGTGSSAGYLAFEDIEVAGDGSFSILLGPDAQAGSFLLNPPEATTVFVRHIYDDWNDELPGEVHIDRVGFEGRRRPLPTPSELAERLRAAAEMLDKSTSVWPAFVQRRYVGAGPPNSMSGLIDTYAMGGARGRWMSGGYYELEPGKALLIETPATKAQYQAIQLTDMWFNSLEHANQVSSLTTRQSLESPDGVYYTVVSSRDPGHANWLDTGGTPRGVFLLRYDGVRGEIPKEQHPSARLVDFDDLPQLIPGFSRVSEAQRTEMRAARRRHLQRRSSR
jgi:hypothetical protein